MPALVTQIEFTHPALLAALVVLPLIAIWGWRSNHSVATQIASATLRCCMMACIIVAAAGPSVRVPVSRSATVAVLDRSLSADRNAVDAAAAGMRGEAKTVEFSDSNLAAGIRSAAAKTPAAVKGSLLLISDGQQINGDAVAAAAGAGLPVSVQPVAAFPEPEVCIVSLIARQPVYPHTTVGLIATVTSNKLQSGNLVLLRNRKIVLSQKVTLPPGSHTFHLKDSPGRLLYTSANGLPYEVRLVGFTDTVAANNAFKTSLPTIPPPAATIVAAADEPFSAALKAAGFQVQRQDASNWQPPELAAESAPAGSIPNLLVLADMTAAQITPDQQTALQKYVQSGGALILTGAGKLFEAPDFAGTVLEDISPVTAAAAGEEKKSSTALVLVIDKSKSMLEEDRMTLARTGAKRAIEVLGQQDQLGVLAFSSRSNWVAPLAPITDKAALLAQIDKLTVADRTVMYPAMLRAVLALEQTVADQRHMILLTDGVSTPGDFDGLARRMKKSGIAVTTVSVGAGADQSILKDIARIAAGKHRHSAAASDLTNILVQAAAEAASQQPPSKFQPIELRLPQGMSFNGAPPLNTYAATTAKTRSQSLLVSPRAGEPLLAWHRYGKGAVAVLTMEAAGDNWKNWKGFPPFIQQLAKITARTQPPTMAVDAAWNDDRIRISINALTAGNRFRHNAQVSVTAVSRKGEAFTAAQTAAGVYTVEIPALKTEQHFIARVMVKPPAAPAMQQTLTIYRNYPAEMQLPAADGKRLLAAVAAASGGAHDAGAHDAGAQALPSAAAASQLQPLFMWLLLGALLAFACDVGARRLL